MCGINKPLIEYRYRAEKKWYNRVCKQCERNENKKLREQKKQISKTLIDGKKMCQACQIYKEMKEFESLDTSRPKECNQCINCRKKQQNYYVENKIAINERNNIYYATNQPDLRQKRKEFRLKNRDVYNAKQRAKYNSDYEFRFASCQRRRIRKLFGKGRYYDLYIGCNQQFFNEWIDYNLQFDAKMTRDNYGKYWHADHVFPCALFTLTIEEHKKICFNWRNYSPLEASLNHKKSANIDIDQVKLHNQRLKDFSKLKNIEVVTWDPFNVLQQPQLPPFIGNNKDEQVETVDNKNSRPSEGKNIEDDESDYDSELEEKFISDSEIDDPQQVSPNTLFVSIEDAVQRLNINRLENDSNRSMIAQDIVSSLSEN
jgi:hypothetical protein